ncbi:MAG: YmfQ family protein [Pseudomonadota bacterium]
MGLSVDAGAWARQLIQLLPRGRAWRGSHTSALLRGLAHEFARADERAERLIDEANPGTALELLSDWERVLGLPDDCSGRPDSIAERQVAAANKMAQRGGQSRPFFIQLAARLGYAVEIEELTSLDVGFEAGDECMSDEWRFVWVMHVVLGADEWRSGYAEFCAGSEAGERLVGFGALSLECLIGRARPAHSVVLFSYSVEPEAIFWADFVLGAY